MRDGYYFATNPCRIGKKFSVYVSARRAERIEIVDMCSKMGMHRSQPARAEWIKNYQQGVTPAFFYKKSKIFA